MKNIILISILIVTSISFSQTLKNRKCDWLKADYEAKFKEWEEIRANMGQENISQRNYINSYKVYLKLYDQYLDIKKEHLICIKDSENFNNFLKTPPAPPEYYKDKQEEVISDPLISQFKPILISKSREIMNEYINSIYEKGSINVAGYVGLSFICNEQGNVENVKVKYEKPKNIGLGKHAIEVVKLARFDPVIIDEEPIKVFEKLRIKFVPPKKKDE